MEDKSDYAATRDFWDWLTTQRDTFERLEASKHPARPPGGREFSFDPCAALRFATEVRRRAQEFEQHWVPQVQAQLRRAQEHSDQQLSSLRNALVDAGEPRVKVL